MIADVSRQVLALESKGGGHERLYREGTATARGEAKMDRSIPRPAGRSIAPRSPTSDF
ncbi:hypothetical protein BCAR13_180013 [Paraburkholderia caribensis]|jgi:hypothetical protein|nr:hypothetical protein BCAR13_180013 [Paraburkholderia caribensis]